MTIVKRTIFVITVLLLSYNFSYADTVCLNNGRCLEGIIKKDNLEVIELEVSSGVVKFGKNSVKETKLSSAEKNQLLRKKWQEQKIATNNRILRQQEEEERQPKAVDLRHNEAGILVDALLDDKVSVRFILDTGASLVLISRKVAQELGFNPDRFIPDVQMQLADGRKVRAKHITIRSIKVQNLEAKNVDAALIIDEAGDIGDGLLGMSFLKRFNFKVDLKEKKLILEKI
ncbi:MAG: retroviral-like aspartic protease family protein [Candidatus Omnitrophica bacterium]|nr:retroviral-like aspartic protease family protein [Candidatus Omnitrophota bacterium]